MHPVAISLKSSHWCPSLAERMMTCFHPECHKVFLLKHGQIFPVYDMTSGEVRLTVRPYCSLKCLTANETPHGIA